MNDPSVFMGFGLANLSPGFGHEEEPQRSYSISSNNSSLNRDFDEDEQLSLELGKLIRVVNDIKHRAPLDNCYGWAGHFNIINSHPVATGSFFQVRKLDGVSSSQPLVGKYPRLSANAKGYGISKSSLQSIKLEIEALCHEPLRNHANIINIFGLGWARLSALHDHVVPVPFLEFATHGTIRHYLLDNETTPAQRLKLGRDVGQGLKALHASGIVHGDLKLENVLVFDKDDGTVIAKLADFGSAVQLTELGFLQRGGTRPWNAPEWQQSRLPLDQHLIDVYSFGLLVWALCIDGESPFPGMDLEEIELCKTQNRLVHDATQSVTEYYEFYKCYIPPRTELEQFDLYMVAVVAPRNVFEHTLLLEPARRSLDRALEGMNPEACYDEHTEKPPERKSPDVLYHSIGRNAYTGLADVPRIVRKVLISDFVKRANNTTLVGSVRGELALQIALSHLDGFTGYPDTAKALDWLLKSAELECSAARGVIYRIFSAVGMVRLRSSGELAVRIKSWLAESAAAGNRIALQDLRAIDPERYSEALEAYRERFHFDSVVPGEDKIKRESVNEMLDPAETLEIPAGFPKSMADLRVNRKLNTFLHCGSAYGVDLDHFKAFIDQIYPSLDVQDEDGNTALLLAMRSGYYHHAKALLKRGAKFTIVNKLGQTPLHWMIQINDAYHVKDLVDIMSPKRSDFEKAATREDLNRGEAYNQTDSEGTPLHWAVSENREDIVTCFLEHDANPTQPYMNMSPLEDAVRLHLWKLVRLLTRYAAKPITSKIIGNRHVPDQRSRSQRAITENWLSFAMFGFPRHQYIIQHGASYPDALRATLIELWRADLMEKDLQKEIKKSLQGQDTGLIEALLSFESLRLRPPSTQLLVKSFIDEARYITPTVADFLLNKISNAAESLDISQLKEAVFPYVCSMQASPSAAAKLLDIIPTTIDELRDLYGYTPFLAAVRAGNFDVATVFLRRGADPDIKVPAGEKNRDPPYMVNILYNLLLINDDLSIAATQYLLEPPQDFTTRKPDFVVCVERDLTALHVAAASGNKTLLECLLKHFHEPAHLNATQKPCGGTALHIAADNGHLEVARALVRAGANVNAEMLCESKSTPMDACYNTRSYQTELAQTSTFWENLWIGRLRVSEYLAAQGGFMRRKVCIPLACACSHHACAGNWPRLFDEAWKSAPRDWKSQDCLNTFLLEACSNGNSEVALRLIAAGADVNCQTTKDEKYAGHTPLHKVAANGDARTALILVRSGADLNIRDEKGRTSAIYAYTKQHDGMVSYLLSQGAPNNFPEKRETIIITTRVDGNTEEKFQEEVLSNTWILKWTEEKYGSTQSRYSMWSDNLKPGPRSGMLAAQIADQAQDERALPLWSKSRRVEGFYEAWSRIMDRQRRAKDSSEEEESLLSDNDGDTEADWTDVSTDEDEE